MVKTLRLAPDLALPLDFATEGVIVLGMRGSGKSNTEARFAEVEHAAGIPFVVVDPKGDWHGIRTSADGTAAGLPVPVFGGLHGDFPLDPSLGKRIADLLVDENLSAVLDVSRMSKTVELPRFLADFFDQLMLRHQEEPHVRTVILEEAHRYIPQQVSGAMARVKEAAGAVLLEGRAWGLGCWACSQRPARINKDILEEVSTAVLHRIGPTATNDKRTIAGWVKHYELSDEIIASITKLHDGQGWVLAPVSLGILQLVQMDRRHTFDSAATPKVGEARRRPSTMADIDAGAIKEALADSIEKAKADDPKELHRRIAALEKELRERPAERIEVEVPVPFVPREALTAWDRLRSIVGDVPSAATAVTEALEAVGAGQPVPARQDTKGLVRGSGRVPRTPPPPRREIPDTADPDGPAPSERKLLAALAQYPDGRTKTQLALLTGYKGSGGRFGNLCGALRSKGWAQGKGAMWITDAGLEALGDDWEPLPTGRALIDHWLDRLPDSESRVFAVVIDAWPESIDKAALGEATGYEPTGGRFGNILSKLRTYELIEGKGEVRLTPTMGEEAERG